MSALTFDGLHHLKFPVRDVEAASEWYSRAFRAERISRLDHRDADGQLFAVILSLPGVPCYVELRHAPNAAAAVTGYDPVTFQVADDPALEQWAAHLTTVGVQHSPILSGFAGQLIELATPDGLEVRLYTAPIGDADDIVFSPEKAQLDAPELHTPLMDG